MVLDGNARIFQAVLGLRTDEELGVTCLSVAEEVTGSRFGFIGEIGPDGFLHDTAISNPGWELCTVEDKTGHRRPPGDFTIHGIYGKVLTDGKGFFTNDPSSHPDRIGLPSGHPQLTAFLGVPLVQEGRTIGMIALGNREGGYGPEQQETLEALVPAIVEAFKRKRAEDSLRKAHAEMATANKELEAFAYSVSHDLKSPLRIIEGFSRAIAEEEKGRLSETGNDYFRRVLAATDKMAQLIDALLSLSRVTQAKLKRTSTHLSEVARSVIEDLRRGDPARRVEWVVPDNITAEGDPAMLRIVITNLLQNAWKFTGKREAGRVELGVFRKDGEATYFVRDNGTGFDMAHADKLFTAFQRLHSADQFPGIGIGLATVQRIIHRHGGRIWAESDLDKGATFYFTIS
jgi:signal transduction histidine kinase